MPEKLRGSQHGISTLGTAFFEPIDSLPWDSAQISLFESSRIPREEFTDRRVAAYADGLLSSCPEDTRRNADLWRPELVVTPTRARDVAPELQAADGRVEAFFAYCELHRLNVAEQLSLLRVTEVRISENYSFSAYLRRHDHQWIVTLSRYLARYSSEDDLGHEVGHIFLINEYLLAHPDADDEEIKRYFAPLLCDDHTFSKSFSKRHRLSEQWCDKFGERWIHHGMNRAQSQALIEEAGANQDSIALT